MTSGEKIVEAMHAAGQCILANVERYAVARIHPWKGTGADVFVVPWPVPEARWIKVDLLDGPFFTLVEAQDACRARMIPKAAAA